MLLPHFKTGLQHQSSSMGHNLLLVPRCKLGPTTTAQRRLNPDWCSLPEAEATGQASTPLTWTQGPSITCQRCLFHRTAVKLAEWFIPLVGGKSMWLPEDAQMKWEVPKTKKAPIGLSENTLFWSWQVYIFNPETGAWRPGPTFPQLRTYPSYLPYGDSFVVFGGINADGGMIPVSFVNGVFPLLQIR